MLHGLMLNWQMTHTPLKLPEPEKISVTLRQPPPPPPEQQKIVKKLPLPPELEPVKQQPLQTLPPPQQKILKPKRKIPVARKRIEHRPLKPLPPPQRKIFKQVRKIPVVKQVRHKPLNQLPPPQRRIVRRRMAPPVPTAVPRLKPLRPLPPAQRKISRRLPRIPAEVLAAQPMPMPLQTLPPKPVYEEVRPEEEIVWEEVPPPQPRRRHVRQERRVQRIPPPQRRVQQVRRRQPTNYTPQPRRNVPASQSRGNQEAAPRYDINPQPSYPIRARRRGLQGTVILKVLVDTGGGVLDLRLARSSGHRILDRAAMKSVRSWRFTPGMSGGRPKQMWVRVPVRFALN